MKRKHYKPPYIDFFDIEEEDGVMLISAYAPDMPVDEGEEWDDAKKGTFYWDDENSFGEESF